jgi:biopolymer transport protein ExbD
MLPRSSRYYNLYLERKGIYDIYGESTPGGKLEEMQMRQAIIAGHTQDKDDEINLTPMLDVVFIMLIFFIVTASFLKESGIGVGSTNDTTTEPTTVSSVLITMKENDQIWIGNRMIDPRAVRANSEVANAQNPGMAVIINAHDYSLNDTLVQVMDASRQAGVYSISLAAK